MAPPFSFCMQNIRIILAGSFLPKHLKCCCTDWADHSAGGQLCREQCTDSADWGAPRTAKEEGNFSGFSQKLPGVA